MSLTPISQTTFSKSPIMQTAKAGQISFDSIWGNIDTNRDGQVSAEEAKNYGFNLFDVKQTMSRNDFEEQFNQRQRTLAERTNVDLTKAFSRVPYAQKIPGENGNYKYSSVIQDIQLKPEEQRTLLELMKNFTLPTDEKDKRNGLYFGLFGNDTYDDFKISYEKLQSKLAHDIQAGKTTTISNRQLAQILSHIDTTDTQQDGKIGSFAQGTTGDCWFLSMLDNYAENPTDLARIKERITKNGDNYTVKLQDPYNQNETITYEVTANDLKDYGASDLGTYSSGDKDVRILEIAMNKMLAAKGQIEIAEGTSIKQLLVHRALGYNTPITHFEVIDGKIHQKTYNLDAKGNLTTEKKETPYTSLQEVIENVSTDSGNWLLNTDAISDEEKANKKGFSITQNSASLQRGHVSNLSNIEKGEDGKIIGVTINEPYMQNLPFRISVDRLNEQNKNIFNPTDGRSRLEGIFTRLIYIPKA